MKTTFVGNIGKDAEIRKVNNAGREDSVCSFWVAENLTKRDGTKKTLWHKVTIWRGYAETMAQYLKAGRKVLIQGTAKANVYTNKANQLVPYIDIQADEITLLDAKRSEEAPEETTAPAQTQEVVESEEMPW